LSDDLIATRLAAAAGPSAGRMWDGVATGALLAGLALLVLPTYWDLTMGRWQSDSQGHEWIILAVAAWLMVRKRDELAALPEAGSRVPGLWLFAASLAAYVFGRGLEFVRIEMLSLIGVVAGLLVVGKGMRALRVAWFPLFFLLFSLPLPFAVVLAVTAPLKTAVSVAATWMLSVLGYPIGRSGVVITIGQYDLLVTEACAGLQTMFTVEALGLLYANLRNHPGLRHNAWLTAMVVPVSFLSNVVRVVVLALVTYHFGDAAGQGFVHGFAGMVLFGVALALIVAVDRFLAALFSRARLQ
jgi:exosortase B